MKISKYGHSCLHVVDGSASILIDPGDLLAGLRNAVRPDGGAGHPPAPRSRRSPPAAGVLRGNPGATLYADTGSVAVLAEADITAIPVQTGDTLDVGTTVEVFAGDHAVIHRDVPVIPNACYLIGGRLLHPGDSLTVLDRPVEILALPTSAPWMAVKEAVDYFRAVNPAVAIPIHEKVLANPAMVYGLLTKLGPADARWLNLDDGHFEIL